MHPPTPTQTTLDKGHNAYLTESVVVLFRRRTSIRKTDEAVLFKPWSGCFSEKQPALGENRGMNS